MSTTTDMNTVMGMAVPAIAIPIEFRHARCRAMPELGSSTAAPTGHKVSLRPLCHPACFVCAPTSPSGLRMTFQHHPDDSLTCHFTFTADWQGYPGFVHGGIVAAALDGAMTNWLLVRGHAAVTAELKVRYRHPVATQVPAELVARFVEASGPVFVMQAELRQARRLAATATAKFVANDSSAMMTRVRS
jgi:acyl-coenzyme A thioesterase PaaI-like protein